MIPGQDSLHTDMVTDDFPLELVWAGAGEVRGTILTIAPFMEAGVTHIMLGDLTPITTVSVMVEDTAMVDGMVTDIIQA